MEKSEKEIARGKKNGEQEEYLFLSTSDNTIRVSLDKSLYLSLLTVGLLVKDRHVDGEVSLLTPLPDVTFRFDKSAQLLLRCKGDVATADSCCVLNTTEM